MAQAVSQITTIPPRRRTSVAKPAAPQIIDMDFGWSHERWVASFVPGPTDIGMVVLLHHDAAELERVVAGLLAFRKQARAKFCDCDGRGPDSCSGNCK